MVPATQEGAVGGAELRRFKMRLGNTVRLTSLISQKPAVAVMLDGDWLDRRQARFYPWWVSL